MMLNIMFLAGTGLMMWEMFDYFINSPTEPRFVKGTTFFPKGWLGVILLVLAIIGTLLS